MHTFRLFTLAVYIPILSACLYLAGCAAPSRYPTAAMPGSAPDTDRATVVPSVTAIPLARPTPAPFTAVPPHDPGVAQVLAAPPAPGQAVEVDAYFAGSGLPSMPGPPPGPDMGPACPQGWQTTLTDRPYPALLRLLNGGQGNNLPADQPWLIAVVPVGSSSLAGRQLPYHGRLSGHFGDATYARCRDAERIFVVDRVVRVYQQDLPDPELYSWGSPADYASWERYQDGAFGYSLPLPPGWRAERLDDRTSALRGRAWPSNPVTVVIHPGETHYDQYLPGKPPALLQGESFGLFDQGWAFPEVSVGEQHLSGYSVMRERPDPHERAVSVLFSGGGYTYELAITYPVGFAASQPLLTAYTAIVEGFRLDVAPGPSPTPPIQSAIRGGPLLSQADALAAAQGRAEGPLQLLSARLVSEAEARRGEANTPCGTFTGHPGGVWVLEVQGKFEGQPRAMRLLLDAADGTQLCGEEMLPGGSSTPTPGKPQVSGGAAPSGTDLVTAADVELDVYSGRPNPEWKLSAVQAQALAVMLDGLSPAACTPSPGELGYRGFVVRLESGSSAGVQFRAFGGQVRFGDPWVESAGAACRADPDRRIESLLLNSGELSIPADLHTALSAQLGSSPAEAPTVTPDPNGYRLLASATPSAGPAPLAVTFDVVLEGGPDNGPGFYCANLRWDFGDGTSAMRQPHCSAWTQSARIQRKFEMSHDYAAPGTYNVRVSIYWQERKLVAEPLTVLVTGPAKP